MRIVYFDCKNGISGDMAYAALAGLLDEERSYSDVKKIIEECVITEGAKKKALSVYSVIAEAEASVHGKIVSDVHFHEVGRREAIWNIIGASLCADALSIDKILCSEINDGKGFIECSHGTIPVPVPAVLAMRRKCDLVFTTDENVKTEMVTPSGLAILIGLGAEYSEKIPQGKILKKAVAFGKRETGRPSGLTAYLIVS